MVYQTGNMLLQEVQRLHQGKVNDVMICQDLASDTQVYYTVISIKNHDIARQMVEIYENAGPDTRNTYITGFTWQQNYMMVFPYYKERPIEQFLYSDIHGVKECEQLCKNIVVECMASGIPYPMMYLQLAQGQIHIQKDGNVHLGYRLDLERLERDTEEKDCVAVCGNFLFHMLESVNSGDAASYQLLKYKNMRSGYSKFSDLYKDLQTTTEKEEKKSLWAKIGVFLGKLRDKLFGILLVLSILVFVIALMMIVSQVIYADIPLMRVFMNTFEKIGTESLVR